MFAPKNLTERKVSIHAPGRGATVLPKSDWQYGIKFQFTHPGGVRPWCSLLSNCYTRFQFTHPGGVRPQSHILTYPGDAFQFTHPGGVRLYVYGYAYRYFKVSIHAPGRGATGTGGSRPYMVLDVSIHAPGRGATATSPSAAHSTRRFNSRTREGCDRIELLERCRGICFNSRTREGCDKQGVSGRGLYDRFQFTHPGGVRLGEGGVFWGEHSVSIHAPGRGATFRGAAYAG